MNIPTVDRPNSGLSMLTDVQLFYLGHFCIQTVARVLCKNARRWKEPKQSDSQEHAKASKKCLFYNYDTALDICYITKDSIESMPEWN